MYHRRGQGRGHPGGRRSKTKSSIDKQVFQPRAARRLAPILEQIGVPEPQPFIPDPFQVEAVAALESSDVLVTAPTGAGKTWIALQAMEKLLAAGKRTWYASPLKALSNAKYNEFGEIFGQENVGILTGDRKINTLAPIVVGTTEILRNQLYDAMYRGEDLAVDLVVLDEAHYLADEDRGVVWEEVMIYLPDRVRLLLLSATIANSNQVASWLQWLRQVPCRVVAAESRPVPLHSLFLLPSGEVVPLLKRRSLAGQVRHFLEHNPKAGLNSQRGLPNFSLIIDAMRQLNLLPAIFFLKSRSDCNLALQLAMPGAGTRRNEPSSPQRRFNARLQQLVQRYPYLRRHPQLRFLRQARVAAHHGGQLPAWKELIETLMVEGHLEAIFSTSTVAAGVNFPARTVVLCQSDRFNGREFVPLSATDLLQMTGRAGRRGKDKVGFALVIPGPYQDPELLAHLFHAEPEPLESRMQMSFTMVLNLLLSHSPEQVRDLLRCSFATFQELARQEHLKGELAALEKAMTADLAGSGCASIDFFAVTMSRRLHLEQQLQQARRQHQRTSRQLRLQAMLRPGILVSTDKGRLYTVVATEPRRGQPGVLARQAGGDTPGSLSGRCRWLPLTRIHPVAEVEEEQVGGQTSEKAVATLEPEQQELWNLSQGQVAKLEQELAALPCASCRHVSRCSTKPRARRRRTLARITSLRRRLDEVFNDLWHDFCRYRSFLEEEGYVDPHGRLTADGLWAARLRLDQPMQIAAGIRAGLLPDHDPALLAGLVAPFVSDREAPGGPTAADKQNFAPLIGGLASLDAALIPLRSRLRARGFGANPPSYWAGVAVYSWATGSAWEETRRLAGLDDGDLAMLIFRTADNLRQLEGLHESHPRLAACALQAIELILREPVLDPT